MAHTREQDTSAARAVRQAIAAARDDCSEPSTPTTTGCWFTGLAQEWGDDEQRTRQVGDKALGGAAQQEPIEAPSTPRGNNHEVRPPLGGGTDQPLARCGRPAYRSLNAPLASKEAAQRFLRSLQTPETSPLSIVGRFHNVDGPYGGAEEAGVGFARAERGLRGRRAIDGSQNAPDW